MLLWIIGMFYFVAILTEALTDHRRLLSSQPLSIDIPARNYAEHLQIRICGAVLQPLQGVEDDCIWNEE